MKTTHSSYGVITLNAVEFIRKQLTPIDVWCCAVEGKEKGCPKSAFLGLCQFGWVKDVPRGEYLSSRALKGANKDYAIQAAQILLEASEAVYAPGQLWALSITGFTQPPANHNQQMNIVLALWDAGLLIEGEMPKRTP